MASYEKKYSADFFKKDGLSESNSDDKFQTDDAQTYHKENKSKENELSNGEETCSKGKTSKGEETYSDNETLSGEETYSKYDTSSSDETSSDDKISSSDETSSDDKISNSDETSSYYKICSSDETSSDKISSSDEMSTDDKTCKGEIWSGGETNRKDETSSNDEERCSEDETCSEDELEEEFNSEDKLISILYRQVVDVVMVSKNLTESTVDTAIHNIKLKLHQAHKRGYRDFPRIDFDRPENCCGYLRRYAICHTGLVKKSMWNFFAKKNDRYRTAKEDITSNSYLKVVSLGGGPGNDLVGFCSALQDIPNNVKQLELTVVDASESWRHVFPEILEKAKTDFGSFSQFLRKKITHHFIKADLTNDEEFKGKNLSSALKQADLLLMVKLISYLPNDAEPDTLLQNVVNSMMPEAKLIFIDYPYDEEFFREIESLDRIYHDALRYTLCFKPRSHQSPSIATTYAHVAIYQKKMIGDEDSSHSDEA